jgi:hypothetical protein
MVKGGTISLIGPMMCVAFARDGKTQIKVCAMVLRMFNNESRQIKDFLGGHLASCLKTIQ